jgi:hypothetical protein
MRLMILRMLASTSLAAFSTNLTPAGPSSAGPLQPARAVGGSAAGQAPAILPLPKSAPATAGSDGSSSQRILPRGSLLDIAV